MNINLIEKVNDFLRVILGKYKKLIFLSFIVYVSSCSVASQNLETANKSPTTIINSQDHSIAQVADEPTDHTVKVTDFNCDDRNKIINFKGVSFRCTIPLVSKIEVSEEPASPLQDTDDKDDYVHSRFMLIKFKGKYWDQHKESYYSPEINIFPIAEFRRAYKISPNHIKGFDNSINILKKIISKKTANKEELPRIPYYDGSTQILAHFKSRSFKNGSGVFFLTQYVVDYADIINNQKLSGVFQGITADNKYYILATFPISLKGLPDSIYNDKFGDYQIPADFLNPKTVKANEAEYKKYLASMEKLLNKQKPGDFQPDLNKLEEMISSLEVNWKE